jgi:hypothetical protein
MNTQLADTSFRLIFGAEWFLTWFQPLRHPWVLINEHQCKSIEFNENPRTSMETQWNQWTSLKIYKKQMGSLRLFI